MKLDERRTTARRVLLDLSTKLPAAFERTATRLRALALEIGQAVSVAEVELLLHEMRADAPYFISFTSISPRDHDNAPPLAACAARRKPMPSQAVTTEAEQ